MSAFKLKLAIDQGSTFVKTITWKTGKPAVAVDLTDCTARMQIRPEVDSATIYETLTTENGGITLGGVAGTVAMRIEAAATAAYVWTGGVYDLEIEFPDGTVRRLLQGGVSVSLEVTR